MIMNSIFNTDNLAENIAELCRQRSISVNRMLRECGLNKSVVDNLKRGFDPQLAKIVIIADYFDVTVDYLVNHNLPSGNRKDM